MKGNVDGEEAKARLKARKRMMDCFSDTRNKRQLEPESEKAKTFRIARLLSQKLSG